MALSQEIKDALNDEMDFVKCPACGYDDADSSRGVKMHYSYADDDTHPGKLPKYIFRCVQCGQVDEGSNAEQLYCSKDCRTLDEVGTLKHKDEDFLRKKIEGEGKRAVQVAEEIGVKPKLVHKWVREYDIGDDYECPSCERSFATSQGVSKHHEEEHGDSIRGNTYECEWCGEENWTPRRKDDKLFPKYCPSTENEKGCYSKSMSGENNPNKEPERKEKISRGLINSYARGERKPTGRQTYIVEETDHEVDSGWEVETDKLLNSLDIEYKYNGHGEYKRYNLGDFTHAPDFVIPQDDVDVVIEVKGGEAVYHQGEKMRKISKSMTERDDVLYILYGDVPELESDIYIEYGNEDGLQSVVEMYCNENNCNDSVFDY